MRPTVTESGQRTADVEVAVVGGGPAGAAVASRLAAAGREVVLFERLAAPRWRASGVYSSPATRTALRDLGLASERVGALVRPISEMVVESLAGTTCRLTYAPDHAVALDRVRLERALLDHATHTGAVVQEGAVVRRVHWIRGRPGAAVAELEVSSTSDRTAPATVWRPRLVVGADGPSSGVARAAGVARDVRLLRKAGVTVHRSDPGAPSDERPMVARMVIGRGWYCGIAPVPNGRVNIGIVLDRARFQREIASHGGRAGLVERIVAAVPDRGEAWRHAPATDAVRVALPLAHRVNRASGEGFLLVGDAAGFIDPLSGDGIHRALVSAEYAADAVDSWAHGRPGAIDGYHERLRAGFGGKDTISWLLQLFLGRPALLEYALRRLAVRDALRRTFGDVVADLAPPERATHPRFLAALLRP